MKMSHGVPHSFFSLLVLLFPLVVVGILFFLLAWSCKRGYRREAGGLRLPPGAVGWPYIGETLQLYSQDPNAFFASKQKRYGEIFKTHLLGCPCVMLASPEAARLVLVTHAHLFKPTYPRSKEQMIGPWALFFHRGDYHTRLRKLVEGSLSPESIRRLTPDVEDTIVSMLESWDGRLITTFHAMKSVLLLFFFLLLQLCIFSPFDDGGVDVWIAFWLPLQFSFDVGIITIFGRHMDARCKEELKKNYFLVDKGYNSFSTGIPGTPYSKAVVARKRLSKILSGIIKQRREKGVEEKDLLGCLMSSTDDRGEHLSDDQIADNVIGVLFAAQDTTASVLTWILKYLHDDAKLLEAVKAEQMAIYESNGCGDRPLTWSQTRSMPLTHKVILETLRIASIISFTFREAVADVEYKGYLIPRGWKVMPLFRNIHHNPEFFPDPQQFDPSRFTVSPKPSSFVPFGNGVHACPGSELAKLEMLILIHHLVTKYRWELAGSPNGIEYGPFPIPKGGLPAKFSKIS